LVLLYPRLSVFIRGFDPLHRQVGAVDSNLPMRLFILCRSSGTDQQPYAADGRYEFLILSKIDQMLGLSPRRLIVATLVSVIVPILVVAFQSKKTDKNPAVEQPSHLGKIVDLEGVVSVQSLGESRGILARPGDAGWACLDNAIASERRNNRRESARGRLAARNSKDW
jgi:hypothetical protein